MANLFDPAPRDHAGEHSSLAAITDDATARALLKRYKTLASAVGAPRAELALVYGQDVAERMRAVREVATAFAHGAVHKRNVITSWAALLAYVRVTMAWEPIEQFRVLYLDKKNQLIADEVMNSGTVDHAPVYPREVVKRALMLDASAIILAHNHPSGDPTPSAADIDITRQVIEAGKLLRISVHDHVIVGRDGIESLKALGLI